MSSQQKIFRSTRSWHELSTPLKVLRVSAITGWAIGLVSLLTVGGIETAALSQPTIADSTFHHPHDIKGQIRYFSEREERIYLIAKPMMIGSLGVIAVLFALSNHLDERW